MAAFDLSEVESILKEIDNTVLCASASEKETAREQQRQAFSKTAVVSGNVCAEKEDSVATMTKKDMVWQFCSEQEGLDRERMLDVHILEATDESKGLNIDRRKIDPYRAVRKFVRSSGDVDLNKYPIRTDGQMKGSMEYLLKLFINTHVACMQVHNTNKNNRNDSGRSNMMKKDQQNVDDIVGTCYTFCMNRLNALRQEFTIGQIKPTQMIPLLQYVCKFYIVLDVLCTPYHCTATQAALLPGTAHWFDSVMHTSTMMSALFTALTVFKDLKKTDYEGLFDIQIEATTFRLFLIVSISLNNAISKVVSIHEAMQLPIKEALNTAFHPIHFSDNLMSLDNHIEIDKCSHEQRRLYEYVWEVVTSIKNGNPARAIKTINGLLQAFPSWAENDVTTTIMEGSSILMAKLSRRLLPTLIVWRLLLMDLAANKREAVRLDEIVERIRLDVSVLSIEQQRNLIKSYFEIDNMDNAEREQAVNESETEDVVRLRDITYYQVKVDKKGNEVTESTLRAKVEKIRLMILE
jgi:hypothetical protein